MEIFKQQFKLIKLYHLLHQQKIDERGEKEIGIG